jgi:hypothetical protein
VNIILIHAHLAKIKAVVKIEREISSSSRSAIKTEIALEQILFTNHPKFMHRQRREHQFAIAFLLVNTMAAPLFQAFRSVITKAWSKAVPFF